MLPDGEIVRNVLFDAGAAAALPKGAIVLDMSSSDPVGTCAPGEVLSAQGVTLVDAPVSGAFDSGFSAGLMVKDVGIAAELARAMGVAAPFAHDCVAVWQKMAAALGAGADHTEFFRFGERRGSTKPAD